MAKEKFYLRPARVLEHVDDPADTPTTLTAAAAKGATALTVASIAGIADTNTIRIGSGETCEWNKVSGAPSGNTVNLVWPLGQKHAIGESVCPGITYDLGDPTEDGVRVNIDLGSQDVNLATTRKALILLRDYASASMEWASAYWSLHVLASALGMLFSRVTGSGTTASPRQLNVDGTLVGESINRGVVVIGKLADSTDFFVELHGVDKDYTTFRASLRQGQLGSIAHRAVASSQVTFGSSAPAYVVNSTLKPTKSKVFTLPSEFGVFAQAASPLSSTINADAAAAATSFTVVSSTNGAPGDRVLIGGNAEDSEILIVDTVPNGTSITTRNQANYPHLTGAPIVEQQSVPFGAPTEEGLDLTIGGSVKETAIATTRFKGVLPATVTLSMAFQLADIILANVAYALGVPQGDISSGRLPVNTNLGSSDIAHAYFRGLNAGGGTIEINAYGCTQEIRGFAPMLSGKDVAKLPVTLRPSTLQFLEYV